MCSFLIAPEIHDAGWSRVGFPDVTTKVLWRQLVPIIRQKVQYKHSHGSSTFSSKRCQIPMYLPSYCRRSFNTNSECNIFLQTPIPAHRRNECWILARLLSTSCNQPLQNSFKICLLLCTNSIAADLPVYDPLQL